VRLALMSSEPFFSYSMARTCYPLTRWWL